MPRRWFGVSLALGLCVAVPTQAGRAVSRRDGFAIQVRALDDAAAGQPVEVIATITPGKGRAMTVEFPARMMLAAGPNVDASASPVAPTTADERAVRFRASVTAREPGERWVDVQLRFSVCSDDACEPASEKVRVSFRAK
jgi:hypothetical protein